jgi:tetratricopeptide (TPR) repeat protein
MGSKTELNSPEMADLAMFLFDEGETHYRRGDFRRARTRFAQSLSVFQQLNQPNYAWIASMLYYLGNISLNEKQAQTMAWGFLKSAAQIQVRAKDDESGANLLRDMGEAALQLGRYALAQQWFEGSEKIYQALGLDEQALVVRKQLDRANILQDRYAYRSSPDDGIRPYEFLIKVHGQVTRKFSVSESGEIQWSIQGRKFDQDMDLGLDGWEVVCENY